MTQLVPVTLPALEPGSVRLHLRLCGLCGTDLYKLQHDSVSPGTVLGHELVGEVEAIGETTGTPSIGLQLGDRVVVPHHSACGTCAACQRHADPHCASFRENLLDPGGFAERLVVKPRAVATVLRRIPDGMRDETALFLEPLACVVRALRRGGLHGLSDAPGVLVLGAGSVGLLHVMAVRALRPAARIIVIDPRADRRETALASGADLAFPPGSALERGILVVFDCVGGSAALDTALAAIEPAGRVVLFAHGKEDERAAFALNPFFKSEASVTASYSAGHRDLEDSWQLLVSGGVDPAPLLTHVLPLDQFDEGVGMARRHEALKVSFRPPR